MDRLVYLFELDSVLKYKHNLKGVAFTKGVQALFCEIINRGNSVAITMNQLTDSQFIREILCDESAYSCLLQLFEYGAVKASIYNDSSTDKVIRTASQYVQQAMEERKGDSFIFSNLPVKKSEPLRQIIADALKFSDLSLLKEEIAKAEGVEKDRLQMVYRFVNMILQISVCETSNIPPKTTPKLGFEQLMKIIINIIDKTDFAQNPLADEIKQANEILKKRDALIEINRHKRSNWLNMAADETSDLLANEIVNICYNYTVEDSVNGVSKHYDDNNFESTFTRDFLNRLSLSCNKLTNPPKDDIKALTKSQLKLILRFAEYNTQNKNIHTESERTASPVYEKNFKKERLAWIRFIFFKNIKALIMSLVYILVFLAVENVISFFESAFSIPIENIFVGSVLTLLLFGISGSLISKMLKFINRKKDIPDVLECIIDMWFHFCDFWRVIGDKYDSYKLP